MKLVAFSRFNFLAAAAAAEEVSDPSVDILKHKEKENVETTNFVPSVFGKYLAARDIFKMNFFPFRINSFRFFRGK